MKILVSNSKSPRNQAFALMMVMFFTAVGFLYLSGAMNWAIINSNYNERNNQYQTTLYAAESADEKVVSAMFSDFKTYGQSYLTAHLSNYRTMVPTNSENSFWSDYEFNNAQSTVGQVYVMANGSTVITNLSGKYAGLAGTRIPYKIITNARNKKSRFAITNAVQEEVSFTTISIFQFAIFYNGLLEFTRSSTLNVRGRVHSNSNIYYGTISGASQDFWNDVTSTQTIVAQVPWFGLSSLPAPVTFHGLKTEHAPSMTLPIGTNNTSAAVHQVIEMPPSTEAISSAMGQQRYYNKAELLILVSNNTVTVGVKVPYDATTNNITWTNASTYQAASNFISTNAVFYDQRQDKTNQVTDIDVGKFINWASSNSTVISKLGSGNPPALLYIADNRTRSGFNRAIRLKNAQTLPSRGLTVASPNALYVQGHFNCPTAALGTTNTSNTKAASLVGDALTVLSSNWVDAAGVSNYTSRVASDTTVNAGIIAGNVETTGTGSGLTDNSGGAMNLPRLLEDWTSRTLTLNGSLVCLYQSQQANVQYTSTSATIAQGLYYMPPTRNINFDYNFADPSKLPPGAPVITVLERLKWVVPPINTITYTGN